MAARRLLVVPYYAPPFTGSGNRWTAMARHLRARGHEVTLVATDAFGWLPDDDALGIVRARDLRSNRLLRRLLGRGDVTAAGGASHERPPPRILTKLLVPEAEIVSWVPAAVLAVRRLLADGRFDCLITSGPPDSVHAVGLLAGRHRPAWVAELRDGWSFEPLRDPFPTAVQRALDRWLERRVVRTADAVIGVTRPIAEDLRVRLGVPAAYVPNGWDDDVSPGTAPQLPDVSDSATLVHTGGLTGVGGSRGAEVLLSALRMVRDEPGGARGVRLVHAGRLTTDERELIDRCGVADCVEWVGALERRDALALQRAGDAVVLLTSRAKTSEATGKLFEYLTAGKPIVALAQGNEAARIVEETGTGITVPPGDIEAVAAALRRVASGELERAYAPRDLERYAYPRPAEEMAAVVEQAIERHELRARAARRDP